MGSFYWESRCFILDGAVNRIETLAEGVTLYLGDCRDILSTLGRKIEEHHMTTKEIKAWLSYWTSANMVAVNQIRAYEQVYQARKYCACMRQGVFADITDGQIWDAIRK